MNENKQKLSEKLRDVWHKLLHPHGNRHGTAAVGMIALVIVIVLMLNLVLNTLDSGAMDIDISNKEIYEITDTSVEYLKGLEDDISIMMLAVENEIDPRIQKFINRYAELSDHISVSVVDPVANPSVLEVYACPSNYVVVRNQSTGKFTAMPMTGTDDGAFIVSTLDYNTYTMKEAYFDGEGLLTSAIEYVTTEVSNTIYTLTGHNETELPEKILNLVRKANVGIGEPVDLLMGGGMPENCDMLIIHDPTADLADDELTMLRKYIAEGGNVIILLDDSTLTNFNTFLADYGMELLEGSLGDKTRFYTQYYNNYGYFATAPVLTDANSVTASVQGGNAMIMFPAACRVMKETPAMMTVESLFGTSSDGVLRIPVYDENGEVVFDELGNATFTEETGTYSEAILSTVVLQNPVDDDNTASVLLFSCPYIIDPQVIDSFTSMANVEIFMNAMRKNLSVSSEFTIYAKSLETSFVTVKGGQALMVFYIAILPAASFVIGLVIWIRRRKR